MDHTEHPGIPQRPPASAYLMVDSTDRQPRDAVFNVPIASPANDFYINRNQALLFGYFTRLAITQLQFDWSVQTIMTGVNDTFVINYGGTNYEVKLDNGYYNPTTLAAEVETQLQAIGALAAFTCIWNPLYQSLQIDSNVASPGGDFFFVTPSDGPLLSPPVSNQVLTRTYRTLGVGNNNTGITSPPTNTQFLGTPKLIMTDYVDIVSRNLTKYQRVKDTDTAPLNNKSYLIARVYLCPPGQRVITDASGGLGDSPFFICVDYNTPKHIKWSPGEPVSQIDLQVLDQYGQLLPWDSVEAPWEFQLTIVASET